MSAPVSDMIRINDQSVDNFTKTNDEAKSSQSIFIGNQRLQLDINSQNQSGALIMSTEDEEVAERCSHNYQKM